MTAEPFPCPTELTSLAWVERSNRWQPTRIRTKSRPAKRPKESTTTTGQSVRQGGRNRPQGRHRKGRQAARPLIARKHDLGLLLWYHGLWLRQVWYQRKGEVRRRPVRASKSANAGTLPSLRRSMLGSHHHPTKPLPERTPFAVWSRSGSGSRRQRSRSASPAGDCALRSSPQRPSRRLSIPRRRLKNKPSADGG